MKAKNPAARRIPTRVFAILFFKKILSHFGSIMKVAVLYV
jgi:hypothetical protein